MGSTLNVDRLPTIHRRILDVLRHWSKGMGEDALAQMVISRGPAKRSNRRKRRWDSLADVRPAIYALVRIGLLEAVTTKDVGFTPRIARQWKLTFEGWVKATEGVDKRGGLHG